MPWPLSNAIVAGTRALRRRLLGEYQAKIDVETSAYDDYFRRESHDSVERAIPPVPTFDFVMQVCRPYVLRHMPNAALDHHVLRRAAERTEPVRLMSLGCGSGDWEFDVVRRAEGRVRATLVDLNQKLMRAAEAIARREGVPVSCQAADVNRIRIEPQAWDIIVCRSSLHHFVELEHVLGQIRGGLAPGGQLLIIGEWIGRKGLQIYPETEEYANRIFRWLPERYRLNRYSGKIDPVLPNFDQSVGSFEAERSEEILPRLFQGFEPVEYVLCDALLSLFFDFRYGGNYDVSNEMDRALAAAIAETDIEMLERKVLRPTALFGIFR